MRCKIVVQYVFVEREDDGGRGCALATITHATLVVVET